MADHFGLTLETTEAKAPLLALLRRHLNKPIADLRNAIMNRQPFLDETPHHNQYSEFVARVTRLLNDLDANGVRYGVEIDGAIESPQHLRNVFQRWHDIGLETERASDLESGQPCIETLEWLKYGHPADGFKKTLKQIIDGDGYECDEETIAWARRELAAAKRDAADQGDD
jgi:hypothetical protein